MNKAAIMRQARKAGRERVTLERVSCNCAGVKRCRCGWNVLLDGKQVNRNRLKYREALYIAGRYKATIRNNHFTYQRRKLNPINGTCCLCGSSRTTETTCLGPGEGTHCSHWQKGRLCPE